MDEDTDYLDLVYIGTVLFGNIYAYTKSSNLIFLTFGFTLAAGGLIIPKLLTDNSKINVIRLIMRAGFLGFHLYYLIKTKSFFPYGIVVGYSFIELLRVFSMLVVKKSN